MDECRRTAERLTPYVDEALPPAERTDVERHLDDCPPCRQHAVKEQSARTVVRECADRLRHQTLPAGLRSRCEAVAREHCAHGRASWRARLVPVTLVAAVAVFIALVVLSVATRRSATVLAAQLTTDHVKCFQAFGAAQPVDARKVEQDLEAKYGWDMHIPPSSPQNGLELIGGRRCLYAEGTIPHVMYRAAGTAAISLFRLEGVTRRDQEVTTLGHYCRIWSRGGNTYVLVAPDSMAARSARLVSYVQQEAR